MTEKEKVLIFLRDNGGSSGRSDVSIQVFRRNLSAAQLDELLKTVLSGLVEIREKKWTLSQPGWNLANQIDTQEAQPAQEEPATDAFSRFKALAKANPDVSPQRLLQLAGRHLGDPLEDSEHWRQFRAEHPEWYLQQPREWYAHDLELDQDGYPMRYPTEPLTAKERDVRPVNEKAWFDRAMRSPGASLEPLAMEMPAYEVANILRVVKKVGMQEAEQIFGQAKIEQAQQLAGIAL